MIHHSHLTSMKRLLGTSHSCVCEDTDGFLHSILRPSTNRLSVESPRTLLPTIKYLVPNPPRTNPYVHLNH